MPTFSFFSIYPRRGKSCDSISALVGSLAGLALPGTRERLISGILRQRERQVFLYDTHAALSPPSLI